MAIDPKFQKVAADLSKLLADDGLLVGGGFMAFRDTVLSKDVPPDQLREMQLAFYAGAQHVFHSMMGSLDGGEDPTDDDMARFEKLDRELTDFYQRLQAAFYEAEGSA